MKALIFTFFIFFSFTAKAIDQQSLDQLRKQGFQVRMGELTGAGSKLSLRSLAGFIHPSGIVMKEECKSIAVKADSAANDPKISDITKVVVEKSVLSAQDFEGFFTY